MHNKCGSLHKLYYDIILHVDDYLLSGYFATGVYYLKLQSSSFDQTVKMEGIQ